MSKVIDCLSNAIRIIRDAPSRVIDDASRAELVNGLDRVLNATDGDDFIALARMKAVAESTKKDVRAAQIARLQQDIVDENQIAPRYLQGGAVESAWRFRQDVDPLPGNRGSDTQSFLTRTLGEERFLIGQLDDVLKLVMDNTLGRFIKASEADNDFVRALLGLPANDQRAVAAADKVRDLFDPYIDRLRGAGVWVEKRDNWWFRDYDLARIEVNKDRFVEIFKNGLDRKVHPDPESTAIKVIQSLAEGDTVGSKNMGIGMRRKIEFADRELEFALYKEFGRGTAGTQLMRVAKSLADETIAAEMFGPLWRTRLPEMVKTIATNGRLEEKGRTVAQARAARQLKHGMASLQTHSTDLTRAANFTKTNVIAGLQNYVSFAFLGMTATWQLTVDPFLSIIGGSMIQGNVFRRATRQLGAAAKLMSSSEARQQMRYLGVWRDGIAMQSNARLPALVDPAAQLEAGIGGRGARSLSERFVGGTAQLAAYGQRMTASNLIENFNRSSHFRATMTAIADNFDRSWDELNPTARKFAFENNGISKRDWDSLRKTEIVHGLPAWDEFQKRNPRAHARFMGMLHRDSENAVVRSDLSDRVVLTLGADPGSTGSLALSTITQFWSWNTRMLRGPLAQSYHRGTLPLVSFSAGLLASTALGLQLRAISKGEPLWDMQDPGFWWKSTVMSGILGPFMPELANLVDPSGSPDIPGAVPSTLGRLGRDTVGIVEDVVSGESEKAAATGAKIVKTGIPNWWQMEWFLNSVYEETLWQFDPEGAQARDRFLREGRVEE